uniref:Uncharacterized protein n=1 Tax=Ciona savignyi TaxID=51511 RepID=H2ZIH1_CIOSA
ISLSIDFQSCNTGIRCPTWTRWSDWGECSLTCGGGTQTSTRTCNTFGQAGATCVGRASRSQICNDVICPSWAGYGSWSSCSRTCGGGTRTRSRGCSNGNVGQDGCPTSGATQSQLCNTQACQSAQPTWSDFGSWSGCSTTCGVGSRSRTRVCIGGSIGVVGCEAASVVPQVCNTNSCPQWTAWVAGSCSVTCGTGTRPFTRTCNTFGVVGASCGNGPTEQSEACTLPACPGNR